MSGVGLRKGQLPDTIKLRDVADFIVSPARARIIFLRPMNTD